MKDDENRHEALAWLAGRLRWERLLTELHQHTEATDEPIELPTEVRAPGRAA
jgi:hypothetical protein